MLRPPESVENKNDHDLTFNIAGLMQSLAERGAKRLRPTHRCGSQSQVPRVASTWLRSGAVSGSSEAAPGGRWDGGMLPPGIRTVSEREKSSYAAPRGAKIRFKLGGTLQIFNPSLWRVR